MCEASRKREEIQLRVVSETKTKKRNNKKTHKYDETHLHGWFLMDRIIAARHGSSFGNCSAALGFDYKTGVKSFMHKSDGSAL